METLKAIATRRSIREFSDRNITDGEVRKILTAGMSGPTCVNSRAWSFLVVRDKETLGKMRNPGKNGGREWPSCGASAAGCYGDSDLRGFGAVVSACAGLLGDRCRHCHTEYDSRRP